MSTKATPSVSRISHLGLVSADPAATAAFFAAAFMSETMIAKCWNQRSELVDARG